MNAEEPLVHTIRGNLPVASLKFEVKWAIEATHIAITETYTAEDGVVVRQDAHVCALAGSVSESSASDSI